MFCKGEVAAGRGAACTVLWLLPFCSFLNSFPFFLSTIALGSGGVGFAFHS